MAEFLLILGAIIIYFIPLLVAAWVRHPRLAYIGGLNAALGFTVVGWVGALVWALRRRKVVAVSYHGDMRVPRSFNTGLLAVAGLMVGVAIVATVGVNRLQERKIDQAAAALYAAPAATEPTSPVAQASAAAASASASQPAADGAAAAPDDQAGADEHGRRRHHRRHVRRGGATYVDGIPGR